MLETCFCIFSQNQAHNLTTIFHMNVLSKMPQQGLSARVLQCSQLPPYTVAVFNSVSKQSCLHTPCSFSPYLKFCRHWNKFGSKCDAFGADMSSRMDVIFKSNSASYWIHDGSSPWWTNKCCSTRGHLSGCFKCSSILACKGTAFNLLSNYIVFLVYTLHLPSLEFSLE